MSWNVLESQEIGSGRIIYEFFKGGDLWRGRIVLFYNKKVDICIITFYIIIHVYVPFLCDFNYKLLHCILVPTVRSLLIDWYTIFKTTVVITGVNRCVELNILQCYYHHCTTYSLLLPLVSKSIQCAAHILFKKKSHMLWDVCLTQ